MADAAESSQIDKFEQAARQLETDDDEARFDDAFPRIAKEYSGGARQVMRDIASSFYLEEALAADDRSGGQSGRLYATRWAEHGDAEAGAPNPAQPGVGASL